MTEPVLARRWWSVLVVNADTDTRGDRGQCSFCLAILDGPATDPTRRDAPFSRVRHLSFVLDCQPEVRRLLSILQESEPRAV